MFCHATRDLRRLPSATDALLHHCSLQKNDLPTRGYFYTSARCTNRSALTRKIWVAERSFWNMESTVICGLHLISFQLLQGRNAYAKKCALHASACKFLMQCTDLCNRLCSNRPVLDFFY